MAASIIRITFTENLPIGAQLGFDSINDGGRFGTPSINTMIWNWRNMRTSSFEVTSGSPTLTPGERDAINFVESINLDSAGAYTVSRISNIVTIRAENIGSITTFYVNDTPGGGAEYDNHPSLVFFINNYSGSFFGFQQVEFEPATNPCLNVKAKIRTTTLADEIILPNPVNPNIQNPFYVEFARGQTFTVKVRKGTEIIEQQIQMPPRFYFSANIEINNSPNGATVIVTSGIIQNLEVEYSIDGMTWQESNTFTGLSSGDYVMHIRDQYGCVKTQDFHIGQTGMNSPFFYISKSLPIRFANRIVWGDAGNYKNDENTLSYESDVKLPHCELQRFQSADIVKTQFLSNYTFRKVEVLKTDGSIIEIPTVQLSNNIGLKDRRDAMRYNLGNGKTGIYFVQGNTYDYDLGVVTGSYTLNGSLPEWAVAGNYLTIGTAWFIIEDIVFDENKFADVLIISDNYIGADASVNVKSIYNRFDYEIYEFEIDMVNFLNQQFQVSLKNEDPSFPLIEYLSEKISVKVRHEDTKEIKYKNSTNTDIVYATGIEGILRIPYTVVNGQIEEENDTYKTDTSAKLLKAELYEVDEFVFEPLTKELWRKLSQALSHEIIFIDGVGYTKNGDFDTEGPLGESNLYVLKAKMVKNGNVYNSSGVIDSGYGASPIEVPGFIESGLNGFVRY